MHECNMCNENNNEPLKNQVIQVPYVVYEASEERSNKLIRRLLLSLLIVVIMLFASNALWLYAWLQYDYVTTVEDVAVNSNENGNANFIGNDGEINNR